MAELPPVAKATAEFVYVPVTELTDAVLPRTPDRARPFKNPLFNANKTPMLTRTVRGVGMVIGEESDDGRVPRSLDVG